MHQGSIIRINEPRGFGFIGAPGQPDVFFLARDLADGLEWNEQLNGRRVRFTVVGTPRGPQAREVQAAD